MKKLIIVILYGWALIFHALLWIHIFNEGSRIELAIVTMGFGLLVIWGVFLAFVQKALIKAIKPKRFKVIKYIVFMMLWITTMALIAEMVSTLMTQTAYLWNLSPREAFITASPNYIEVVTRHSVIVFLPQFMMITLLNYRYQFKPFHWFLMYGFVGYINEWLAFGTAALWVSIPYWIIIYGWMVYLPTHGIIPENNRLTVRFYHYFLAIILIVLVSIPWTLFILEWLHT